MAKDPIVPPSSFDTGSNPNPSPTAAAIPAARQGDETRPVCTKHNCLMKAVGTRDKTTSYRCPVDDCREIVKKVRADSYVPREPRLCPSRLCSKAGVYLEAAARQPDLMHKAMVCPKCGFSTKEPSAAAFADVKRRQELERRKGVQPTNVSALDALDGD